jgi:hypothetical protein
MPGKGKRLGLGLEVKTMRGSSGRPYLVFRTQDGNFHVFREVNAKKAASDCGAALEAGAQRMWKSIWKRAAQK